MYVCIPFYYLDNMMRPNLLKVNCTGAKKVNHNEQVKGITE